MKKRMEATDVLQLNELQQNTLRKLWEPKEGDFILNASANNRKGHVFANYRYQPYDDRADWRLEVEAEDKRAFLFPLLNILDMLDWMLDNGYGKKEMDTINWKETATLFDQVYALFLTFLTTYVFKLEGSIES